MEEASASEASPTPRPRQLRSANPDTSRQGLGSSASHHQQGSDPFPRDSFVDEDIPLPDMAGAERWWYLLHRVDAIIRSEDQTNTPSFLNNEQMHPLDVRFPTPSEPRRRFNHDRTQHSDAQVLPSISHLLSLGESAAGASSTNVDISDSPNEALRDREPFSSATSAYRSPLLGHDSVDASERPSDFSPVDEHSNYSTTDTTVDDFYLEEPLTPLDEASVPRPPPERFHFPDGAGDMSIPDNAFPRFGHHQPPVTQETRNDATEHPRAGMEDSEWSFYNDTFEQNLDFTHFLKQWLIQYRLGRSKLESPTWFRGVEFPPILEEAANVGLWQRPPTILRRNVNGEIFDQQGINWRSLGVAKDTARKLRDVMYQPYRNIRDTDPTRHAKKLPDVDRSFRFQRVQTKLLPRLAHFQLRNLMSAVDKNSILWVGESKVNHTDPDTERTSVLIDLAKTKEINLRPVRISAMKATHGVVVAGGFNGEYAMGAISALEAASCQAAGRLTNNEEAITNHVDICLHRVNGAPQAVFSSNDKMVRVYDVQTDSCVSAQPYDFAVNCTATSPDGRLRLIVGDTPDVHIVDAEHGVSRQAYLQTLTGHSDHGFACCWSPCGHQIATGNQDGTIQVFDTRMWKRLTLIACDVAGYRSLAFSPVGGGPRTLAAAEPADRVSLIDAQTYSRRQVHSFFGEIGGIDFLPDGNSIVVANLDKRVGGLMWYERVAWEWKGRKRRQRRRIDRGEWMEEKGDEEEREEYEENVTGADDWVNEDRLDVDRRVRLNRTARRRRGLGLDEIIL